MLQLVGTGLHHLLGRHAVRHIAAHAHAALLRSAHDVCNERWLQRGVNSHLLVSHAGVRLHRSARRITTGDEHRSRAGVRPRSIDGARDDDARPQQRAVVEPGSAGEQFVAVVRHGAHRRDTRSQVQQPVVVLHMRMHVPQAGQQRAIGGVDDFGTRGHGHAAVVADRRDPVAAHDHRLRGHHASLDRIEQVGVNDRDGAARCATEARSHCRVTGSRGCELRGDQFARYRLEAATHDHPRAAAAGEESTLRVQPDDGRRESQPGYLERGDAHGVAARRDLAGGTGHQSGAAFRQDGERFRRRALQRLGKRRDVGRHGRERQVIARTRLSASRGVLVAPGKQRADHAQRLAYRNLQVAGAADLHGHRQASLVEPECLQERRAA